MEKIYDLNINLIQSVTLLKDAAAKAIYGSKAANGVVVIETIPPVQGRLRVSYNANLNINARILQATIFVMPPRSCSRGAGRQILLFKSGYAGVTERSV